MVHLEFGLDAPVGGFGANKVPLKVCHRRIEGPAPNCPDAELAASSWPRRIGIAESAAPSCPRPIINARVY